MGDRPLSQELREGTREAHARAESSGFVRRWLRGALDPVAYREHLARLARVYGALEGALDRLAGHPLLAPLDHPALRRRPALAADLAVHRGALGHSAAAEAYAARIDAAARSRPELLVAHCYTRYIGDLSGGLLLGRLARRALGGDQGFAFHVFPGIPDPRAFKAAYRRALDALPVDAATARELVAEAVTAFELSRALFVELEPMVVAA
jgi:heme oxygenase